MKESAFLLTSDNISRQDRHVIKVLQFFGVPSCNLTAAELVFAKVAADSTAKGVRVLCSTEAALQFIEDWEQKPDYKQWWMKHVHSAFIYPADDTGSLQKLARILTGDDLLVIDGANSGAGDFVVSNQLENFSGVMTGIRVTATKANFDANRVLNVAKGKSTNIISLGHAAAFLKIEFKGVPVFLSTSKPIDIEAELTSQNFDVRDHFLSAVPVVLYIKWAFAETCWRAPETNACLVIDDPLLKPTHGFVNFRELLSLMKRHKFSTNIAFIPWNWRRSTSEVARLFRENPEQYSVSVHGCDHIRAEFGSSNQQRLYWKAQKALDRMNRHESITGIHHDRVMVFPQGIFSEAAMNALKRTDLIAAVNNDIVCVGPHRRAVAIYELWDTAVMGYSNFPIFTRRYPWEGIENFAFDALLGKPAIIVIHHDYCSDHCSRLISFIERLNALKPPLTWQSLGEVVLRSCRQRELSQLEVEVEMYGTELRLENRSERSKRYLVRRRECEPSAIREIRNGSGPIAWNFLNGHVSFEIVLGPGESKTVGIKFHELAGNGRNGDNLPVRLKTMLRRYLSEMRDNYVTPAKLKFTGSR